MSAHTVTSVEVASGTTQQNLPVGIITLELRRFRLTVPSSPLFLKNDVAPPGVGTTPPLSGKNHSPCLLGRVAQHGLLSVMHWSPLFDVALVSSISVMRITLLLG